MAGAWPTEKDRQDFIDGILYAQAMGLPNSQPNGFLFHFADERTYAEADSDGRAWDPRVAATPVGDEPAADVNAIAGKKVLGVSSAARDDGARQTAAGSIDPQVIQLTFLPSQWGRVSDFTAVTIDTDRYIRTETLPKSALFDIDIVRVLVRIHDQ